jgi:hypothetical protein
MDAVLKYGTAGTTADDGARERPQRHASTSRRARRTSPPAATAGWKATVATLKDASVEFEMVWDAA